MRMMEHKNKEEREVSYSKSIELAKKAVGLDLVSSENWYVLGNAHLTNFFVNEKSIDQLDYALKAYLQTEKL